MHVGPPSRPMVSTRLSAPARPVHAQAPLPTARPQPSKCLDSAESVLWLWRVACGESPRACPRPSTHKFLVVVIGEEHLEARGPVVAPPEQSIGALMPAHVAVPGVFLYGSLSSPWAHQKVHTLHTKAPGRKPRVAEGLSAPGQSCWAQLDGEQKPQARKGWGHPHLQQLLFPHMSTSRPPQQMVQ